MSSLSARVTEYAVDPLFTARWSPRAFTDEAIPRETLLSFIEAARWAPSASNEQPWRFVYALRDGSSWAPFLELLNDGNRRWAQHAAALLVIVSRNVRKARDGNGTTPSVTHAFDTGAAWAQLALQAALSGWSTHAIGGFDRERARTLLQVPDDFSVHTAVAIGRRGERDKLPDDLQAREVPNQRLPLSELVFEGRFER